MKTGPDFEHKLANFSPPYAWQDPYVAPDGVFNREEGRLLKTNAGYAACYSRHSRDPYEGDRVLIEFRETSMERETRDSDC